MNPSAQEEKLSVINPSIFGEWALVTGASSGIGQAFARQLAASGMNLVLVSRRKEVLDTLALQYQEHYNINTLVLDFDLTQDGYLEKIQRATQHLDIGLLVSNAGAAAMGAFVCNEREHLKSMLKLNVIAQMELAHVFARRFVKRPGKSGLLMLSSAAAMQGLPYSGNYSGAKAYILCLGESLHNELKHKQVHVTALIPGPTHTPGLNERLDIDISQLPGKVMSAEAVAKEGLKALLKNKATHIAGLHNRIMIAMMPRKIMIKMAGFMMKKLAPERLSI